MQALLVREVRERTRERLRERTGTNSGTCGNTHAGRCIRERACGNVWEHTCRKVHTGTRVRERTGTNAGTRGQHAKRNRCRVQQGAQEARNGKQKPSSVRKKNRTLHNRRAFATRRSPALTRKYQANCALAAMHADAKIPAPLKIPCRCTARPLARLGAAAQVPYRPLQ